VCAHGFEQSVAVIDRLRRPPIRPVQVEGFELATPLGVRLSVRSSPSRLRRFEGDERDGDASRPHQYPFAAEREVRRAVRSESAELLHQLAVRSAVTSVFS
jgi:hypothetical protein